MKIHVKIIACFLFALVLNGACRDKYVSGAIVPASGYLVIEGFINAGIGPTNIKLTKTTSLDTVIIVPERGAAVEILSSGGSSFPLTETQPGQYMLAQLAVDPTQKYHVHIKTIDGREYLSDTSSIKITQPIDNVSWTPTSQNVQIFVSTHDDTKQSQYYLWSYVETWQYSAVYYNQYNFNPIDSTFTSVPKADDTLPNTCWMTNESNSILITTTAQFNSDVVNQFPITQISYTTSNRLIKRYSILVKQMTLPRDWYEWVQKIKKNTESLGSIFDAQPSQTGGNFHCTTNPGEPVIGWVGCTTQEEKRIFISRDDLPSVPINSGYETCTLTKVIHYPDSVHYAYGYIAEAQFDSLGGSLYGFFAYPQCVDCRWYGGVPVKPSFW